MIIDVSDFNDPPYKIPNQEEQPWFKDRIEKIETDILKLILGYTLWKEFTDALDAGSPAQKWVDLRDGAEYEYGGKTYKYEGVKDFEKPAIYSIILPEITYKMTNVGMQQNLARKDMDGADLSKDVDPLEFQANIWNEYVSKVIRPKNGFYGFMIANESDYEDWEFTEPQYKNRFSL